MSPLEEAPVPAGIRGLRIAVLVCGGIAAYKVADLVSRLHQAGCPVRVGMTASAVRFVGPPTFQALSGNPVQTSIWSGASPEPHVQLGDWAQLILLAPATANVIARLAHGQSDDLVTAALLAARCPVVVAPAMNDAMWAKRAVRDNLAAIEARGAIVVSPESGHLASGHLGEGRLAGPAAILGGLESAARTRYDLAGKRVVVSAGGTRERIDPVRYIGNYSSGKMGYAVAAAAADRGAEVVLVSTAQHPEHPGVRVRSVESADEMLAALAEELPGSALLVMAAAVADYRVAIPTTEKIRRESRASLTLELVRNVDVLAGLAAAPATAGVYRVGFAAEGAELELRAAEKLHRKGLDAIVANDVSRTDIAFGSEFNAVVVLFRDGTRVELERAPKREIAERLLGLVAARLPALEPAG